MINWFESLPSDEAWPAERERGQMLLVMAMAMVGLLVAAGIAVDVGVLFMRKAQLDRAVDAAALAGVAVLEDGLDGANMRGMQLLAANGIILDQAAACGSVDWDVDDYCGAQQAGTIPGALRYHIEVHWESETYFMQLIRFHRIPLTGIATAEYFPLVDVFASDTSDMGLVQSSNQSIFGPEICTNFGDPYTPTASPWYSELNGAYTYRIIIPPSYTYDKVRVEIFDPDTYNPPTTISYRVHGVDGTSVWPRSCNNQKDPCLLGTPWSGGGDNPNPFWFVNIDENRTPPCSDGGPYVKDKNTRTLFRLYYYEQSAGGTLDEVDLAFYIGKTDWNLQPSPTGAYGPAEAIAEAKATNATWVSPGAPVGDRMPAFDGTDRDCVFDELGVPVAQDLCVPAEPETITEFCETYRAGNPGHTNANRCEGNGDFVVDLRPNVGEVPNIYIDPNSGTRQLYLQVRGLSGASENGYDFWVGPVRDEDTNVIVPASINARQVYIQYTRSVDPSATPHSSHGVGVYGMGHLPMNSNVDYPVDIPLTYLGPEYAGQVISIEMFDPDAGAQDPVYFFFDSIPTADWAACYDDHGVSAYNGWECSDLGFARLGKADVPSANGQWQSPPYTFTIPSDDAGVPFYGGRLISHYRPGKADTYGWKITLKSRPFLVD